VQRDSLVRGYLPQRLVKRMGRGQRTRWESVGLVDDVLRLRFRRGESFPIGGAELTLVQFGDLQVFGALLDGQSPQHAVSAAGLPQVGKAPDADGLVLGG